MDRREPGNNFWHFSDQFLNRFRVLCCGFSYSNLGNCKRLNVLVRCCVATLIGPSKITSRYLMSRRKRFHIIPRFFSFGLLMVDGTLIYYRNVFYRSFLNPCKVQNGLRDHVVKVYKSDLTSQATCIRIMSMYTFTSISTHLFQSSVTDYRHGNCHELITIKC